MRTTKVKRLWPVLALAPLFALAAILTTSLWHNGPAPGTPPAAEAQGRGPTPTPIAYGSDCLTVGTDNDSDQACFTYADSLLVSTTMSTGNQPVVVYITGAGGTNNPAPHQEDTSTWRGRFPKVQASDGTNDLGKKGVGEYTLEPGDSRGDFPAYITVHRSWADDAGNVYVFLKENHANWNRPANAEATALPDLSSADGAFAVVQVVFLQPQTMYNGMTIQGLGASNVNLPGSYAVKPGSGGTPVERRIAIGANEESSTFNVYPSSSESSTSPGLGGQLEIVTEFTEGSALKRNIGLTLTDTEPGTELPPDLDDTMIPVTLEGWEATGPVKAEVTITHIARNDARVTFDPIEFYRIGPPATVTVHDQPQVPHRTVPSGNTYGKIQVRMSDALGQPVVTPGQRLLIEGADAAAADILDYANEAARKLEPSRVDTDVDVETENPDAYEFDIKIKEDASSGTYRVNLKVIQEVSGEDDKVLATTSVSVRVIGTPTTMEGALRETTVNPGEMLMLSGVMFSADGESAYTLACHLTEATAPTTPETGGSICDWAGKEDSDRAVLGSGGMGLVNTDGTASIMVKDSAGPGTYTLVVSDGRDRAAGVTAVTSKELEFTVRGRPTRYTLDGPDHIDAATLANYTIKATDAAGNLPYLPPDVQKVGVVILGAPDHVRTLGVMSDGNVTLNARGEASFTVVVGTDTPSGSEITVAISGVGSDPVSKTVTIGPMTLGAPSGVMGTATVDGTTASVALTWTAGEHATRHWIAGIKQADWDANNFDDVIWTAADDNTMHTVPDLEVGQQYVFTVAAGNAAGQWSGWAPLFRITPRAASTGGGGGPANPFQPGQ